jgi:diacylglycerol O-acyltransferase / wax synthase
MDRMSPLDATFWDLENEHASLHIGGVAIFEGPAPSQSEVMRRYRSRIASMPRYRQKMRKVPLGISRPVWVDDPAFDAEYHLRRTAVASPGGEEELTRVVGRLMSSHLDANRPLWEGWVIEGLADGRWALMTKVHHSMVDGIAGMDLFTGLFDAESPTVRPRPRLRPPWPTRPPGSVRIVTSALVDGLTTSRRAVTGLVSAGMQPRHAARIMIAGLRGTLGYVRASKPFAPSSLNGPLGSPRRYRTVTVDISDIARVREAFGGSLNDVVLGIVTAGFRELLIGRGEKPHPHAVRCLVPVSVRRPGHEHELANEVSALLVELPVDFADAATAYGAIMVRMRELKASHEAEAGELATTLAGYLPPPAVSALVRTVLHVPHRVITTVATNVPGPRRPAYLLGRRMLALYPYVPIADRMRIGVAVASYDGRLFFGITADRDSTPDAGVLTAAMSDGLTELAKAADAVIGERS